MPKKEKFPLELDNGVLARDIDEVRKNFILERMIGYFIDGTLLTWLDDRYYEQEADFIEDLNIHDPDFKKKLCAVFQVPYTMVDVDVEKINRYMSKVALLRQITKDETVIRNVKYVAFNQEEMAEIIDAGYSTVYLCGSKFVIPLRKKGIRYIGINNPTVFIYTKIPVDWRELGIEIIACEFDEKYQKVLKDAGKPSLPPIQSYEPSELSGSLLKKKDWAACGVLYTMIKESIDGRYDADEMGAQVKDLVRGSGLDNVFDMEEMGSETYKLMVRSGLSRAFHEFLNQEEE